MFQNPEVLWVGGGGMKLLTRAEELVLIAVYRLEELAYCVPIRENLCEFTGQDWSFGSIYDALDRLERKGHLRSRLSEPIRARGGRSKPSPRWHCTSPST